MHPWIVSVSKAVTYEVEAEYRQKDQQPGRDPHEPVVGHHEGIRSNVDDAPPGGQRVFHAEAEKKGLIVEGDQTLYRVELAKKFGVRSCVNMNERERKQVINWLKNFKLEDIFEGMPEDMIEQFV